MGYNKATKPVTRAEVVSAMAEGAPLKHLPVTLADKRSERKSLDRHIAAMQQHRDQLDEEITQLEHLTSTPVA